MTKTILLLLFIHTSIFIATQVFLNNWKFYKDLFRNYSWPGELYDISAYVILAFVFIFSAIFKKQARMFGFVFYLMIWLCLTYLAAFYLNFANITRYDNQDDICTFLFCLFSAVFGVAVMVVVVRDTVMNFAICNTIALIVLAINEILMTYLYG